MDNVFYNGKSVPKSQFRAFVYSDKGESKICNTWWEYERALSSGFWKEKYIPAEKQISDKKPKNK